MNEDEICRRLNAAIDALADIEDDDEITAIVEAMQSKIESLIISERSRYFRVWRRGIEA